MGKERLVEIDDSEEEALASLSKDGSETDYVYKSGLEEEEREEKAEQLQEINDAGGYVCRRGLDRRGRGRRRRRK